MNQPDQITMLNPPPYESAGPSVTPQEQKEIVIEIQPQSENMPTNVQIQAGIGTTKKTYCGCCERSVYPLSLCLTLLFLALLITTIAMIFLADGSWAIGIGVVTIIALIGYEVECAVNKTSRYLWNLNIVEDTVTMIARLVATPPAITLHCRCSHQEMRTRTVTRTQTINGRSHTTTHLEHYWVTVVTYRGQEAISYVRWEDHSGQVTTELLAWNAIRIDLSKSWAAGDTLSHAMISAQIASFDARNRYRDRDYSQWVEMHLNGFTENVLSIVDLKRRSIFLRWGWYAVLSFAFLLTWPYRLWFSRVTTKGNFHFRKVIFKA